MRSIFLVLFVIQLDAKGAIATASRLYGVFQAE